jgi:hypothetical protein
MLSDERREFVRGILDDGIIVKCSLRLWKGTISFSCHEDDVNHWRGHRIIPSSRYRLTCSRKYHMKEFKTSRDITKFFKLYCNGNCYRTRYGLFVPRVHYDSFFEKFNDAKRRTYELRDTILRDRDRMIEELKKQYVPVAHDMWVRRYGDGGEPTQNYIEKVVQMYVDRFPNERRLKSMYNAEVYQINPFMDDDSIVASYVDNGEHNDRIYRAFYDAIIERRQSLKVVCMRFLDEMVEEAGGNNRTLSGICKRLFRKMRNYINCMYYDKPLFDAIDDMCDNLIVPGEGRDSEEMISMVKNIIEVIDSNTMLLLRV